ncbi:hypothetical protein ACNQKP_09335 [Bdellovibrio bacteriovorus]|uniref:hypothetical protein n=1 Tax=Bdellovibrio bacteriovorus TaxID=959 RepID=UPI003AA96559
MKTILILFALTLSNFANAKAESKDIRFYTGLKYTCIKEIGRAEDRASLTIPPTLGSDRESINAIMESNSCEKTSGLAANYTLVSALEIKNFITTIRESVCNSIRPGSIKIGLGVDSEGKVFGIGVGANGSIEINIDCR